MKVNKNNRFLTKMLVPVVSAVLILTILPYAHVSAAEISIEPDVYQIQNNNDITITPFAEEIEYHYAGDAQGRLYYRIWSLTQGRWITDWILYG